MGDCSKPTTRNAPSHNALTHNALTHNAPSSRSVISRADGGLRGGAGSADERVRHAAWFSALADTPRDTPAWAVLRAGFELVSLIDHGIARLGWRRPGLHRSADARRAVSRVRLHPLYPVLERILHAIDRDTQSGVTLVDALTTYAALLERDALGAVAADVYDTADRVGRSRHVTGLI
jgi:hypothetical protein